MIPIIIRVVLCDLDRPRVTLGKNRPKLASKIDRVTFLNMYFLMESFSNEIIVR